MVFLGVDLLQLIAPIRTSTGLKPHKPINMREGKEELAAERVAVRAKVAKGESNMITLMAAKVSTDMATRVAIKEGVQRRTSDKKGRLRSKKTARIISKP